MKVSYVLKWRLHSKTKLFKIRVAEAKENIEKALSLNVKFGISWSGGKDSTVLTHLVKFIQGCPIISQFDDCDWQEKRPYMERVSKDMDWKINAVCPNFSVFKAAMKADPINNSICSLSHWITQKGFLKPVDDKFKELGCRGRFLGLRIDESDKRRKHLFLRGALYQKKNGDWICNPLAKWSVKDVFAYLTINNIEINPCYFNNRFFAPEEIRLAWALPTPTGFRYGDAEHIKYYYPRHYMRLKKYLVEM